MDVKISKESMDFIKCLAAAPLEHRARSSDAVASYGLNRCEISILTCLALDSGISSVRDIERYVQTSKSLISRSTEHLRREGYIRTNPDPEDRRVLCLRLEDKAAPVVLALKSCLEGFLRDATADISREELDAFKATASKIVRNIQRTQES